MPHTSSSLPKRLRPIGLRRLLGSVRAPCLRMYPDTISFSKMSQCHLYHSSSSLDIWLSIVSGSVLGKPPSLDLGSRREANISPGRRTRVRPTASRRVSGREAVNTRYDGELRLLSRPHDLRCEFSYDLYRHMLVVTIKSEHTHIFWYFADRASQYIYLNINQLDALNFIMSLFHASTCFEHKCSSSGGQNCTIQSQVSSHL